MLRTQGRLLAASGDIAAEDGLTGAQGLVLTAVVRADRPPTVPQIGRSLGRARQSVQRLADILVELGLLVSKENPDHKRAPLLVPTEAGRAVYARLNERSRSWIARVSEGISEDDLVAATVTLRALRDGLQRDAAKH
ncbi:MarR family winged helix-turn-helix transcriptional regulator [Parafrankia sp. FMc2]|uniref:MarR family winged helix-turn-helix transcriptional regulator n=1 Tax=Parafrankia sp. FMc2 TaxID=3233196 RepID=UPI0034D3C956